ncbi:S-layer homology domain-containing protein [Geobacillus stearothermophilus]|uniref:S-layer homology domain-containing protein n=1 Tax=Geobacillus stearothermophilus TaxID=1422 RepID=UPI003D249BA4
MKKRYLQTVSIFLVMLLFIQLLPMQSVAAKENKKFTDVTTFQNEINQLVELGIIQGYPDGTFRPNNPITRLQAVTMIVREMKLNTSNRPDPKFKDVKKGMPGYDIIAAAVDEGIVDGKSNGTFAPYELLTRAQMAKILVKAYKLKSKDSHFKEFKDVPSKHWAYSYIGILASNNITKGYSNGTFKPDSYITRAHFAVFLSRYINKIKNKNQEPKEDDESEKADIEKKITLKADKTNVYYIEPVALTLEINDNNISDFTASWKATGGTLSVAQDGKSAQWKATENVDKEYTITVTVEVKTKSGKTVTVEKQVSISTIALGGGATPTVPTNPTTPNPQEDSDKDGLTNSEEAALGTDPSKVDTDGDGLSDFYEIHNTETDPSKSDTDSDGLSDADEDRDQDRLTNKQELELGTNPRKVDTDVDGLNDEDEVKTGTDPLKYDTDGDNLNDKEEIPLGFNPTMQDTDGNGVIDGDEVVAYKTTPNKANQDEKVMPSVTIRTKASEGSTTTITNLQGDALLNEDIPGYIGPAFEFNTDVQFSEAQITFTYDESVVTDNFRPEIFYYNEEKQRLERLANQVHDPVKNTVTATVSHFSKYILLNGEEWDKIWEKDIRPPAVGDDGKIKSLDVVFSIDSSGSMRDNDPQGLRKEATKNFVDALKDTDRSAVVDFDYYGRILVHLTNDKDQIKVAIDSIDATGGTNLYDGIKKAIDELVENSTDEHIKYVIFLTDGDGDWDDDAIQYAKDNHVVIYTIGLGNSVNKSLLERIAEETGGKFFFASDASELNKVLKDTANDTIDYTKDSDTDGIPDYLENEGIRTGWGEIYHTDPNNPDTDEDGLLDGEEATPSYDTLDGKIYFKVFSNPEDKKDSDGDGLGDKDENRDERMTYNFTVKHALMLADLSYVNMEDFTKLPGTVSIPDLTKPDRLGTEIEERFKEVKKVLKETDPRFPVPAEDLKDWYLLAAEDSHFWDSGFGAFAVKHGDMAVISYRGSDSLTGAGILNDWLVANRHIIFKGNNRQADYAKEFAAEVILNHREIRKLYIVGHSLGGFLAQVVSYNLKENTLDEVYCNCPWNKAKKRIIKEALGKKDIYKFTRTFNAAPFVKEDALLKLTEEFFQAYLDASIKIPDWLYQLYSFMKITGANLPYITGFNPAVPYATVLGNEYDKTIFNYSMSWDTLHLADIILDDRAEKLGSNPLVLEYSYKGKESKEISSLRDLIKNLSTTIDAHDLKNFYPNIDQMKVDEDRIK